MATLAVREPRKVDFSASCVLKNFFFCEFQAIMREQEDERLAKQFFDDEQKFFKQLSTTSPGASASSSVAVGSFRKI
jgi:hypothetical protein